MAEYSILLTILMAFIISVLLSPIVIPFLRKLKLGQAIREEGPKSHMKKSGTPTMGGLVIMTSIVATTLFAAFRYGNWSGELGILLFVMLGYGALGFLDDFIKVALKRNLGLTSGQKLLGQTAIALLFFYFARAMNGSHEIRIPIIDQSLSLGWLYGFFVVFWLVGFSNAVNLTDGLDGLLSGTASIAFGAFGILAWYEGRYDLALFAAAVVGALLGFLVFNAHPAKVFMGDTGSLALGGAFAAFALLGRMEILSIVIGGIFVIETLSVILQVFFFKTTGRRIFRMSPLHHHYELKGWSEWRVVATFWAVGLLFAILGIYIKVWL